MQDNLKFYLKFHRFSVRNIKGWLTKPPLYIAFMPP